MSRAGEALARVLFPEIVEDVRDSGARIAELTRRLRHDAAAALGDELACGTLDQGGEETRRAGFVLGVVGEALGLTTLLGRREEEGVVWTLEVLTRALARERIALVCRGAGRLRQDAAVGEGWELALLLASWLLAAAEEGAGRDVVCSWRPRAGGYLVETDRGLSTPRARALGLLVSALALPDVRLADERARSLELPDWALAAGPGECPR